MSQAEANADVVCERTYQMAASVLRTAQPSVFLYEPGEDLHLPHLTDIKDAGARGRP